ncbi:unnamed protein product [Rhizoctonia solani]|uniref:non-specific serine/threonine protein kinase n=1 Tax=Rhizoctonia solani TaxID=456999 RepID=A0A8H3BG99_9AGAM|nr:unnamed protein product [Rhizoctonia solani]
MLNRAFYLITKLGFGTSSTVWLARDVRRWWWQEKHVALKITVNDLSTKSGESEIALVNHIARTNPLHPGRQFLRTPIDTFKIQGPNGTHSVQVYEPMRESLCVLRDRMTGRRFSPGLVKTTLSFILSGLDYLHNQCHVVHGDLNTENVLIPIESPRVLNRFIHKGLFATPEIHRANNRVTYLSRQDIGELDPRALVGPPKIIDFGASTILGESNTAQHLHNQLVRYKAPELLLGTPFGYGVDIWNLGLMTWDLLQGDGLLEVRDLVEGVKTEEMQLAEIIGLLGPPPKSIRAQGSKSHLYFDSNGHFKFPELVPQPKALKERIDSLQKNDRPLFLDFLRSMLNWDPSKRKPAQELLVHPWLVQEQFKYT